MARGGNELSRNPNMCASCSSMADGMDDVSLPQSDGPAALEGVSPTNAQTASVPSDATLADCLSSTGAQRR